jgi:hypothetical protein
MRRHIACATLLVIATFVLLAPQVADAAFVQIIEPESELAPVVVTTDLGAVGNLNQAPESASFFGVLYPGNSTAFANPTFESIVSLIEPGSPNVMSDEVIVQVNPVIAATDSEACPFGGGTVPRPCQLIAINFFSFPDGTDVPPVGNSVLETGQLQNITALFLTPSGGPVFPAGSLTITVQSPTENVPEPGTLMLLGLGFAVVTMWPRKDRS